MSYIAYNRRKLHTLDISNCTKITDIGIHTILQQCKELSEFNPPS